MSNRTNKANTAFVNYFLKYLEYTSVLVPWDLPKWVFWLFWSLSGIFLLTDVLECNLHRQRYLRYHIPTKLILSESLPSQLQVWKCVRIVRCCASLILWVSVSIMDRTYCRRAIVWLNSKFTLAWVNAQLTIYIFWSWKAPVRRCDFNGPKYARDFAVWFRCLAESCFFIFWYWPCHVFSSTSSRPDWNKELWVRVTCFLLLRRFRHRNRRLLTSVFRLS